MNYDNLGSTLTATDIKDVLTTNAGTLIGNCDYKFGYSYYQPVWYHTPVQNIKLHALCETCKKTEQVASWSMPHGWLKLEKGYVTHIFCSMECVGKFAKKDK